LEVQFSGIKLEKNFSGSNREKLAVCARELLTETIASGPRKNAEPSILLVFFSRQAVTLGRFLLQNKNFLEGKQQAE
jgi:hypothetical protein